MKFKSLLHTSVLVSALFIVTTNSHAVTVKDYDETIVEKLAVPNDEDMKRTIVQEAEKSVTDLRESIHIIGDTSKPNPNIRLDEYVKIDQLITQVIKNINLLGSTSPLKFRNEQDKQNGLKFLKKIRGEIRPYLGKK